LYDGLVVQCKSLQMPFVDVATFLEQDTGKYGVIIDALFGFSFKGPPRPPFDEILAKLSAVTGPMLVAVDIPSGWHVEDGDQAGSGLRPSMLISLTAPKLCARHFKVLSECSSRNGPSLIILASPFNDLSPLVITSTT
jgi:NAD(P)H-hydrate repair Nnr-like enzyme with NAD(P)H-hydrate epimerase domain